MKEAAYTTDSTLETMRIEIWDLGAEEKNEMFAYAEKRQLSDDLTRRRTPCRFASL